MAAAGVPIVPGTTEPVANVDDARKLIADTIGFPVAVKAAGGGGGKGFRVALTEEDAVIGNEIVRHKLSSRIIHWSVALFFFGAMFSGAPAGVATRIATACGAFGVAWQLADDILDLTSESAESGKTPGTDLREGVLTLPMLHALRSAGPGDARLVELLGGER